MPTYLYIILVVFGIILIASCFKKKHVYEKQPYLMTSSEIRFFKVLNKTVGNNFYIFAKVRIADILSPKFTLNKNKWWKNFTKISSKHIDFVLCNKSNLKFACCIELDDASHNKRGRHKRDVFVNSAFSQAGMPLLRIKTANNYPAKELKRRILTAAINI